MKTIYININGEIVQSTDDVIVIGGASDAIVDAFYIELGMGILAKSHVRGVSNKSIVTDFAQSQPDEFKMISGQWEELKEILLGDDPTGTFDVTLPAEYLHWLHYNENQAYIEVYDKKYRGQKQAVITIDVEGLYEDSVDALRRKAVKYLEQNDNAGDFSDYELVVNDDLVTRNSKLVGDIKKKCDGIAFVPFGKFERGDTLVMSKEEKSHNKLEDGEVKPTSKAIYDHIFGYDCGVIEGLGINYFYHYFRICDIQGNLIKNNLYIPFEFDDFKSDFKKFRFLAIDAADNVLYKIDKYGIVPICDYADGLLYGKYLSKDHHSPMGPIAERQGEYLKVSQMGKITYYEDCGDHVKIVGNPSITEFVKETQDFYVAKSIDKTFDLKSSKNNSVLFRDLSELSSVHSKNCRRGDLYYIEIGENLYYIEPKGLNNCIINKKGEILFKLEVNERLADVNEKNRFVLLKEKRIGEIRIIDSEFKDNSSLKF